MTKRVSKQQRLRGLEASEHRSFTRLHRSLGPRLAQHLEEMRDDFVAVGQPYLSAQQIAAELWAREQADRLSRYLRGSGPNAGRVTW